MCSWQALASTNESLSGCTSMMSLQIKEKDEVIEAQEASLKELCQKLGDVEWCCATRSKMLEEIAGRIASLEPHTLRVQREAAEVG